MRVLLAILLAGCAPVTRFNVEVSADPHVAYQLAEVDRAIEALDIAMASGGLLNLGDAEEIIASQFVLLHWRNRPFRCGLPYADGALVNGCESGHMIEVGAADCIGNTALTHELTHMLLAEHNAQRPGIYSGKAGFAEDPDPDHLQTRWWQMAELANAQLREKCVR